MKRLPAILAILLSVLASMVCAVAEDGVDTALVIAVDVSQSVDEGRYKLQMEGIASAFDDPAVVAAITSGSSGKILVTLVIWADDVEQALPWTLIGNVSDASAVAAKIRALPPHTGEFTCMARMLRSMRSGLLQQLPLPAARVVIDVSGDGIDNCDPVPSTGMERDKLVADGRIINGLPIIVAGENDGAVGSGAYRKPGYGFDDLDVDRATTTMDEWFRSSVIGGTGAFLMPARGYDDFGRAFRQKFVTEVSCASDVCEPEKR